MSVPENKDLNDGPFDITGRGEGRRGGGGGGGGEERKKCKTKIVQKRFSRLKTLKRV